MNLKQLASELGLSPTTVSRALNGYPEVSEATRLRVTEAARHYNYRPNTQAKRLATGRAMAIGHIIPLSTRHEIVNPVFADFIAGAGDEIGKDRVDDLVPGRERDDVADRHRAARGQALGLGVRAIIVVPRRLGHAQPRRL